MLEKKIVPIKKICLIVLFSLIFFVSGNSYALQNISQLKEEAQRKGVVKVIVGLKLSGHTFSPEGMFTGYAAVLQQRRLIKRAGDNLLQHLTSFDVNLLAQWPTLPYIALEVDEQALGELARSEVVTSIHKNMKMKLNLASAASHVGANTTWSAGYGGKGQAVVIIDTGIDKNHPFFGGRVIDEACFSSADLDLGEQSLCPNGTNQQRGPGSANSMTASCLSEKGNICDHGTHVAGIAAGRDAGTGYNGMAPEADIIAIQVFTRINSVDECHPYEPPCLAAYSYDIISALNYVYTYLSTRYNIAAVNMSLGGGKYISSCDNTPFKTPIDNLLSINIPTVVASGNDDWKDAISAPACVSTAVAVGGVTDPEDRVVFNINEMVDLLAPGVSIYSSVPGGAYECMQGTSMAAPVVTGAFAVIRSMASSLDVNDSLTLFQRYGAKVKDTRYGNVGTVKPRIQLDEAVAHTDAIELEAKSFYIKKAFLSVKPEPADASEPDEINKADIIKIKIKDAQDLSAIINNGAPSDVIIKLEAPSNFIGETKIYELYVSGQDFISSKHTIKYKNKKVKLIMNGRKGTIKFRDKKHLLLKTQPDTIKLTIEAPHVYQKYEYNGSWDVKNHNKGIKVYKLKDVIL